MSRYCPRLVFSQQYFAVLHNLNWQQYFFSYCSVIVELLLKFFFNPLWQLISSLH